MLKKISLRKALILKNSIISKIKETEERIAKLHFDPKKELMSFVKKRSSYCSYFVALKTTISNANKEIEEKIFTLSELKSYILILKSIPCDPLTTSKWNGEAHVDHVHEPCISYEERLKMISDAQESIDNIQEEINSFNSSTFIEVEDEINGEKLF